MMKATVSGSFRRHMSAIHEAVCELNEFGVEVLSPSDPRIVAQIEEFVFVASDKARSIKVVEDRHLECIRASDFLWLVAPDGYVGQSASMELGYAIANRVPIFCTEPPSDGTLRRYVCSVDKIGAVFPALHAMRQPLRSKTVLVDPLGVISDAQDSLDRLRGSLVKFGADDSDAEVITQCREQVSRILVPRTTRSTLEALA